MVAVSFLRREGDVDDLHRYLKRVGAEHLGLILKIETTAAFARLPEILLHAMRSPLVGVMIARGDLAVEAGYERLAELQEEILWLCEAAHLPVIWATEVLDQLARTGQPSRAEVTDAAMGQRAECIMLNKGPHIDAAIVVLDNILRRMSGHQRKTSPSCVPSTAGSNPPDIGPALALVDARVTQVQQPRIPPSDRTGRRCRRSRPGHETPRRGVRDECWPWPSGSLRFFTTVSGYPEALAAAPRACEFDDLGLYGWALIELIEAAARSGARPGP